MTGNANPEKGPGDRAHSRDKVREWLIDALSLATAMAAVHQYQPDGTIATIVVFVGAYAVGHFLWGVLWLASEVFLYTLTGVIYVSTLIMALNSLPAMLLSALLPGVAQIYWIWALWPATGNLFHPLTLACLAWLILLGITIFEQNLFANWRHRFSLGSR